MGISYSIPGYGPPAGFTVIFALVALAIVGTIAYVIIRGARQYARNEASPRLSVAARVVAKRVEVSGTSGHHDHSTGMHTGGHTSTDYYVTFEVESGDRMELRVSGGEYGMLVEGDTGRLAFQGTRYQGFERQ